MSDHIQGDWGEITNANYRSGGQWVAGGAGGGGGGGGGSTGEWNWQDPPSRSTTVYHSNVGGSIGNALSSLSSDEELILDDGPYTESFDIPNTSQITLSGGSGGATINSPGVSHEMIDAGGWSTTSTSCSTITKGDTTISVGNASIFSNGDSIWIQDTSEMYHGISSSDLRNTGGQYKGELSIVESVDTGADEVTLYEGAIQDYNDPSGDLEARQVDWAGESLHINNITFDGGVSNPDDSGPDMRAIYIDEWMDIWVTDCTFQNWNKDGYSVGEVFAMYTDNCHIDNVGRYGVSHSMGSRHVRVRDCTGEDMERYLIQCGGGAEDVNNSPAPAWDIMSDGCHLDNTAFGSGEWHGDAHWGAENVQYLNGSTISAGGMKIRGYDQHLIGGSYDCGGSTFLQSTQIARQSSVEGIYCENGSRGWTMWPKEGYEFQDLTMEDCQFENMSATPFRFRADDDDGGNPADVSNLQVINSSWNGEWIDDQMIENSDGDGVDNVTWTTEQPPDQTPAEYFG